MTVFFELQQLVDGLRQGQIPVTDVLNKICNDPEIRERTRDRLREAHIFDEGFPPWLVDIFKEAGLSSADIEHAMSWPADQKEALRAEISYAYDTDLPLAFGWDITRHHSAQTEIRRAENEGPRITLFSPRAGLESRRGA